jgi:hypothetical protein
VNGGERSRLVEVLAALSLATDLGAAWPPETRSWLYAAPTAPGPASSAGTRSGRPHSAPVEGPGSPGAASLALDGWFGVGATPAREVRAPVETLARWVGGSGSMHVLGTVVGGVRAPCRTGHGRYRVAVIAAGLPVPGAGSRRTPDRRRPTRDPGGRVAAGQRGPIVAGLVAGEVVHNLPKVLAVSRGPGRLPQ